MQRHILEMGADDGKFHALHFSLHIEWRRARQAGRRSPAAIRASTARAAAKEHEEKKGG